MPMEDDDGKLPEEDEVVVEAEDDEGKLPVRLLLALAAGEDDVVVVE